MHFSTFVLTLVVTVGIIGFGASLVARILDAAFRLILKTRPGRVVSRNSSFSGEFIEAEREHHVSPAAFIDGRVVDSQATQQQHLELTRALKSLAKQ